MPSRAELNIRAAAVGFDPATVTNDSKLEQKVLWLEKNSYAVSGTAPTTTFTLSGAAGDTETFTLGTQVYTMKTTLTGVIASSTLTSNATIPNDGDIVYIGQWKYIFKTTLSVGAAQYLALSGDSQRMEVLINGSAANALTNLKKAINASGSLATDYGSLTTPVANPIFQATTLTATTLLVTAFRAGSPSYVGYKVSVAVSASATTLSWTAGGYLVGGVNPVANEILIGAAATNSLDNMKDAINGTVAVAVIDVGYSSATVRHPSATAGTKTASTLVITTDTNAAGGLVTTETFANGAFTGGTLASGVLGAKAIANVAVGNTIGAVSGDRNTSL